MHTGEDEKKATIKSETMFAFPFSPYTLCKYSWVSYKFVFFQENDERIKMENKFSGFRHGGTYEFT